MLADALTSVLAIVALLAGRFLGAAWMDPMMGLVGAALVTIWALGLLRQSGGVLLDRQAPANLVADVRAAIEDDDRGDRVTDLHIWSIGPGIHAAQLVVVSDEPLSPEDYRAKLPAQSGLVHVNIEVQRCPHHADDETDAQAPSPVTSSETNRA